MGGGPCEFQLILCEFSQKEMRKVLPRHLELLCGGRETEPARNDKELGVALGQEVADRKGRGGRTGATEECLAYQAWEFSLQETKMRSWI